LVGGNCHKIRIAERPIKPVIVTGITLPALT
jgi:hypothetical protein